MKSYLEKIKQVFLLMRFHKPVGIYLLLWPTLWALWLAGRGHPPFTTVLIFVLGVIVMRSLGCVINDIADRKFDPFVERTRDRPLASGRLSLKDALFVFFILLTIAFTLALQLNHLTLSLAFVGAIIAVIYPFLKRVTHFPQLGLGIAFALSVPMAFAALTQTLRIDIGPLFLAAVIWPFMYDTLYAMVDRIEDCQIGVKSTAVLWGDSLSPFIITLQSIFVLLLVYSGILYHLKWPYFLSLVGVVLLFFYQIKLVQDNQRASYFRAFLNNQWVGFVIFLGIFASYLC